MALKENEVPQQLYLNVGSTVSRSQYSVLYMGMPLVASHIYENIVV